MVDRWPLPPWIGGGKGPVDFEVGATQALPSEIVGNEDGIPTRIWSVHRFPIAWAFPSCAFVLLPRCAYHGCPQGDMAVSRRFSSPDAPSRTVRYYDPTASAVDHVSVSCSTGLVLPLTIGGVRSGSTDDPFTLSNVPLPPFVLVF